MIRLLDYWSRRPLRCFAPFILALLGACATVGTPFDIAVVESMQPGVTTLADAVNALGPDSSHSVGVQGINSYGWSYARSNGFTGKMESAAVFLAFDKNGKLLQKSSSVMPGRSP